MHLEFWGAAGEVTGSCFLIHCGRSRVLVDCGLIQGGRRDEERNADPFPFDPRQLDAVVLTHAHLDHSGRLPLLVSQGFGGTIYTHRATRDLCRIMLADAAFLAERDAEIQSRKLARKGLEPVEPLYTKADVDAALHQFRGLNYDEEHKVAPGVTIRLNDAGHILGSASVEVWLEEEGLKRKLLFSGDLGHAGAPLMRDPVQVDSADLVILESTYGNRNHRSWQETWDELGEIFSSARADAGNILIPAFAVGRTQEILFLLHKHFRDWGIARWHIFLDSPMAIKATDAYIRHSDLLDGETHKLMSGGEPFQLPNLRLTEDATDSMALNRIRSGAIIIAGSGMCDGGRIRHHFKHNIWRSGAQVLMVGFQAQGTLGRRLVDGATHIKLWGETMRVAAKVHTVGGLSAHAGQSGLLRWYSAVAGRPPVVLVHGEQAAQEALAEKLRATGAQTTIPAKGDRLDLADLRSVQHQPEQLPGKPMTEHRRGRTIL